LNDTNLLPRPPNGQPVCGGRVAGICALKAQKSGPMSGILEPHSFELRLRSTADLVVVKPRSWWTLKHFTFLLGIVTVTLTILISALVLLARRRLKEQKRQRDQAEKEFAAILSERNRMAREIHDTLAQGLTAISFQLRIAKKSATATDAFLNEHLDAAQELARSSLAEARNSIWNMRSQVLETTDLAGALENILKQMVEGLDCQTEIKVTGPKRRLAPVTENNLLRFGQEAITNAVRHAQAGQITVQLDCGDKYFRLSVRDDGCGFDSSHPPKSSGGFGLLGIRERAKELQGEFEIQSAVGKGTTVSMTIPLSD
jgi:signal transduction histidine kinase